MWNEVERELLDVTKLPGEMMHGLVEVVADQNERTDDTTKNRDAAATRRYIARCWFCMMLRETLVSMLVFPLLKWFLVFPKKRPGC